MGIWNQHWLYNVKMFAIIAMIVSGRSPLPYNALRLRLSTGGSPRLATRYSATDTRSAPLLAKLSIQPIVLCGVRNLGSVSFSLAVQSDAMLFVLTVTKTAAV